MTRSLTADPAMSGPVLPGMTRSMAGDRRHDPPRGHSPFRPWFRRSGDADQTQCPSVRPRVNLARVSWKMRSVSARLTPAAQSANSREVAAGTAVPPVVLREAAADGRPDGRPRPGRCRDASGRADILACPAVLAAMLRASVVVAGA